MGEVVEGPGADSVTVEDSATVGGGVQEEAVDLAVDSAVAGEVEGAEVDGEEQEEVVGVGDIEVHSSPIQPYCSKLE